MLSPVYHKACFLMPLISTLSFSLRNYNKNHYLVLTVYHRLQLMLGNKPTNHIQGPNYLLGMCCSSKEGIMALCSLFTSPNLPLPLSVRKLCNKGMQFSNQSIRVGRNFTQFMLCKLYLCQHFFSRSNHLATYTVVFSVAGPIYLQFSYDPYFGANDTFHEAGTTHSPHAEQ